jgi:hypothetical protein
MQMSDNLALIIALAAPVLVMVVLRVNAAMVFLSLCLGIVLVDYVAGEASSLLSLVSVPDNSVSASTIRLVLLFAPAVATCVITLLSMHGRLRTLLNILPAIAASAFAVLLTVPLLAPGLRFALEEQTVWQELVRGQALVVGAGAFISLMFLWFQRRSFRHNDKRRR